MSMGRKNLNAEKERARAAVSVPARRWQRRSGARPKEILDAALAVFAEKGFAAARMEEIAARAGVTKGTIYLYFDGKESLFKALLEETAEARINTFMALGEAHQGPIGPLIAQILRGIGHFLSTTNAAVLPKIVIAEAGNFPELARFHHDIVVNRVLTFLAALVARGQERGEFRALPPQHAARLIVAPVLFIAIWRTTFAQFATNPTIMPGSIECHIETLLQGLAADNGGVS